MALLEDGLLFASLTISLKRTQGDEEAIKTNASGTRFVGAIIAEKIDPQIVEVTPGQLKETKTGWRFFVTFKMPSGPQVRLKILTKLRAIVDSAAFPELDILNGTLSYNDDDGVFVSRRVEEGTREHGALFKKPFAGLKVGESRPMNSNNLLTI
jgi:hypothetical protein